jgi:cysteine synthase A
VSYLARVGRTPLVPVGDLPVWCKLEFLNPSGSTKDRVAWFLLDRAMREGRLGRGDAVCEASSGSTAIAMALACSQLGLRFVAVMPESVSSERVAMIRAFGAEIRLTPAGQGVQGSIAETHRLASEDARVFLPRQFDNPDNALAHQLGTAAEVLAEIPGGRVGAVVSGVGTGGTLVGLFHGCPGAVPVLARPVALGGGMDSECCSFSARVPGVVECMSTIFDPARLAGLRVVEVPDTEAIETARELIRAGFPVGPSSGLNLAAARRVAGSAPGPVVTVFPDRMERYFSTELFR